MGHWFFLVWLSFASVISVQFSMTARRTARESRAEVEAVRAIAPLPADDVVCWQIIGAGLVQRRRGSRGLVNASWPWAVLEVQGRDVVLRLRPTFLAMALGAAALHCRVEAGTTVFPARGWAGSRYIGFRSVGRRGYFACGGRRDEIIRWLEAAGYDVSWIQERIAYW